MLNLFPITIFGSLISSSNKAKKNEKGVEAAQTMWRATLDLDKAFPYEARMLTYPDKNGDDYEINKNLIRDNFPIQIISLSKGIRARPSVNNLISFGRMPKAKSHTFPRSYTSYLWLTTCF